MAKVCDPTNMKFEEFRDGKILRNYVKVEGTAFGGYYTKAVLEDQIDINDDQETIYHDEGAMNPYEVYNSKPFLCSDGSKPCDKSFAGANGNLFKSTGLWLAGCPVFHQ
jgi:hypothetical protein